MKTLQINKIALKSLSSYLSESTLELKKMHKSNTANKGGVSKPGRNPDKVMVNYFLMPVTLSIDEQ